MDRRTILGLLAGGAATLIPGVKPTKKPHPTPTPTPTSTPPPIIVKKQGGKAMVVIRPRSRPAAAGGGSFNQPVTHGEQLTINDVGPWALQAVTKGTESVDTVSLPGRGYWLMDTPSEWRPTQTYVYNNSPSNKGGTVPGGGLTIDGYSIPAGTEVAQFRNFSAGDFSAQGQAGNYLFRGCRFRSNGIGQSSQFNDFTSTYTNRLFYCDMGSPSSNDADWQGSFWKSISNSTGHIMHRNYCSWQYVTFQPNNDDAKFIENYVEDLVYFGGEAGPPGQPGDPLHMASLGCEGGRSGFRFMRNRIVPASPDDGGHVFTNGATIAMEGTGGGAYNDCQVVDNYLSGLNYVILNFGEDPGSTNIVVTGNKITTLYFTNGGASGAEQVGPSPPIWGSTGNVKSNNTWADDYGTGGNGNPPPASRQYPAGNGPRTGTTAF